MHTALCQWAEIYCLQFSCCLLQVILCVFVYLDVKSTVIQWVSVHRIASSCSLTKHSPVCSLRQRLPLDQSMAQVVL